MRDSLFSKQQLQVAFGGYSHEGVKEVNQDAFAAYMPKESHLLALKGATLCIADGISSSQRSQDASQMLVQEFIDEYYTTKNTWSVQKSAAKVLNALNAWFCAQNRANANEADDAALVSTFSALVIKGQTAHIFHIGDSRVYLLRGGKIRQLTTDHVRRYSGRWVLSRAMGIDPKLDVELICEPCEEGDVFIMTTDGVHEAFSERELADNISELIADQALETAATAMCNMALERGSVDNVSCLLSQVEQLHAESYDEARSRLTARKIPPALKVGNMLNGYKVDAVLHHSTRSSLYLVTNGNDERYVLKAPSPNFTDDLTYLDGFAREQWLGQQLDHRTIMKSYPSGTSPFLYSISEYIEGRTLAQWLIDNPKASLNQIRGLLGQIIAGLRVLQRQGIVHRDIKPDNFMIDEQGYVKMIDLGTLRVDALEELSGLVGEDLPVGSVNYIAPEYLLHSKADVQSDMFSLGCMIYELLSGKLPYDMESTRRRTPTSYAAWQYQSILRHRPDIPAWVDLTLKRATEPNPEHRYDAYSEFLHAMQQPSDEIIQVAQSRPLIERDPVRFWQFVSALLLLLLVISQIDII